MGLWDLTGLLMIDLRTDLVVHTINKTMTQYIFGAQTEIITL